MHRLHIFSGKISGSRIRISDYKQIHHIRDVLRLKTSDEIIACDEKGNEYASIIESISSSGITLKIKQKKCAMKEKEIRITVACAIPKKSKFDDIVDKLTQLGVYGIIPMSTERVIVKLDKHKEASRLLRWRKIAASASQQSQRNTLPFIAKVNDMEEILAQSDEYDLKLIPTLFDKRSTLKQAVSDICPENILVLIGPEGDFSSEEIKLAINAGCIPVKLGGLVLRVETAAIAVTSMLNYALGYEDI